MFTASATEVEGESSSELQITDVSQEELDEVDLEETLAENVEEPDEEEDPDGLEQVLDQLLHDEDGSEDGEDQVLGDLLIEGGSLTLFSCAGLLRSGF